MLASEIRKLAKTLNKSKPLDVGEYLAWVPGWGLVGKGNPFPPKGHPSYAIVADLLGEYNAGND